MRAALGGDGARLREAGPRRARRFTWTATAERLDALMRGLLGREG